MNSRTLLPLSVALNFLCIVGLLWRNRTSVIDPFPAPPPVSTALVAETRVQSPVPEFHWSQVESTNYFAYIANLRSVGCPELTIRDIISADLLAALATALRSPQATAAWSLSHSWGVTRLAWKSGGSTARRG